MAALRPHFGHCRHNRGYPEADMSEVEHLSTLRQKPNLALGHRADTRLIPTCLSESRHSVRIEHPRCAW